MLAIKLCTIAILVIVFLEDLRLRAVQWALFPLLLAALLLPHFLQGSAVDGVASLAFNLGFLLVQGGAALALVMLRRGEWSNPFHSLIGSGDVLFLAIVAAGLSTERFLPFYLSGLVLCLLGYGLLIWLKPTTQRTVPTAGFLALYLACWVALEQLGVLPALHTGTFAHDLLAHG
ncbi:MAG: hypothetical protein IPN38_12495 [Flavobacteriales bacterium]|nr:hypothetical protein [Flavobacteriales bacterium]MBL0035825.1 hypothetical protein [Flavobacteriales bacterium]